MQTTQNQTQTKVCITLSFCKRILKHFLTCGFLFVSYFSFSQLSNIDSLLTLLKIDKEDTNKVNHLNGLAISHIYKDPNKTFEYANQSIILAEKINFIKGIAYANQWIAWGYFFQGNYSFAMDFTLKAEKIFLETDNYKGLKYCYTAIGTIYNSYGQFSGNIEDFNKALEYYNKVLDISKKYNYDISGDLGNLGILYIDIGNLTHNKEDYNKALEYCFNALKENEKLGDKVGMANSKSNIGQVYLAIGKLLNDSISYIKSLEYFNNSIAFFNEMNNLITVECLNGIGNIYLFLLKNKEAIIIFQRAYEIANKTNSLDELKKSSEGLSCAFMKINDYEKAYRYQILFKQYSDSLRKENNTNVILKYEYEKKKEITAAENKRQRLMLYFILAITAAIAISTTIIAVVIFRSQRITKRQKSIIEKQKILVDEKNKNLEDAFKNIEIISKIGEKITSTLNLDEVINILYDYINSVMDATGFVIYIYNPQSKTLQMKYGIEKGKRIIPFSIPIDSQISINSWCFKNNKEVFINDFQNEYSKYVSEYFTIPNTEEEESVIMIPLVIKERTIGIITIGSFKKNAYSKYHLEILKSLSSYVAVALNNTEAYQQIGFLNKNLSEEKKKIEEHQKSIIDSINYAKRLQEAMLPPIVLIKKHFLNSFVIYKPKDIVAGDFYWIEVIDKIIFIAAADCTGHGVPGAMISVVCSNALNRTVKEFNLRDTGKILDSVTDLVLETFEKSTSQIKDGMDISLLSYNMTSKQIQWSGAYNPLWIIQNGKMNEITADKQPVGKYDKRKPFTTHNIEHSDNSVFYLFTDGLPDQFGGPKGKKFMYKRFENHLTDISKLPMDEQQTVLEKTFQEWKGSLEQVDDVTVIGIKI